MKLDRRRCPARLKLVRMAASTGQHTNSPLINPLGRCPSQAQGVVARVQASAKGLSCRAGFRAAAPRRSGRRAGSARRAPPGVAGHRPAGDAHLPGVVHRRSDRDDRYGTFLAALRREELAARADGSRATRPDPSREPLKRTAEHRARARATRGADRHSTREVTCQRRRPVQALPMARSAVAAAGFAWSPPGVARSDSSRDFDFGRFQRSSPTLRRSSTSSVARLRGIREAESLGAMLGSHLSARRAPSLGSHRRPHSTEPALRSRVVVPAAYQDAATGSWAPGSRGRARTVRND